MPLQFSALVQNSETYAIWKGWMIAQPLLPANAVMPKKFSAAHTNHLTQSELGSAISFIKPQGGILIFFWMRLSSGGGKTQAATEFAKRSMESMVALVSGVLFSATNTEQAMRHLSFATVDVGKFGAAVGGLGRTLGQNE